MEVTYKIALALHILSGMTALVTGLIAIISRKGKTIHRKAGLIFFFSMLSVSASALIISIMKHNMFLLHIAIFALYMNYSGYRSIKNKKLLPNSLDWTILFVAMFNCFFMIWSANIILMIFGGICSLNSIQDLRLFITVTKKKEIPKNTWLLRHLGMMLGTYISTSTAFLVVNVNNVDPKWLPWLLPTFIGTPLIIYWSKKYSVKKSVN